MYQASLEVQTQTQASRLFERLVLSFAGPSVALLVSSESFAPEAQHLTRRVAPCPFRVRHFRT